MRASLRPHLQHAPVYDPRRTRHVTGLRARKKCNHSGDFASIAGSSERDAESLRFPRVLVLLASHRRGDLAGRHGVRGDVVLTELEREGLDQSADAVLGSVVRTGPDTRLMLVNAGDCDQPAAIAVFTMCFAACRMQTKVPSKLVAMILRHSS